jgi:hypothetical protein
MENFTYPGEKAEKGAERQIDVEGLTKLFSNIWYQKSNITFQNLKNK